MGNIGTDTPLTFEQWIPLVHHVATKRFPWAAGGLASREDQTRLRGLDQKDLLQEGYIALLHALNNYKKKHVSRASFKTYAYKTIYAAMLKYTWANATPLKTWDKAEIRARGSDAAKESLAAALKCVLFSDLLPDCFEFSDRRSGLHEAETDECEHVAYCIAKLREKLSETDFNILLDRASGATYTKIGEKHGFSGERARVVVKDLQYAATDILKEEILDNG